VGVAITDCLAALYAVQGSCSRTSRGRALGKDQFVDIALLDSAVSILGLPTGHRRGDGPESRTPRQTRIPSLRHYEPFTRGRRPRRRCCGEPAVVVAILCRESGAGHSNTIHASPPTATGLQNRADPERKDLRAVPGSRTVNSLIDRMTAAGVPCGRVRDD
jgi:crotonobetainyl-CoA:carnitine CoA-transferase CaiB-like acyl-CoA transferase